MPCRGGLTVSRNGKRGRGRKKEVIRTSTGFKQFLEEEKNRVKREKGVEPSFEDIIIGKMSDVSEEDLSVEEDDGSTDFMNLF